MAAGVAAVSRANTRQWIVVLAMALPLMMLTIDGFGLTVALPSLGRDLNTSTTTLAWVLNAFVLAFAAPQIAVGRLADIYGRRLVVLFGLTVFMVGSLLAGTAQSAGWLITARVIQGLGTAMSFVTSLSIVSNTFSDDQRGQAIGIWAAAGTIGQSIGPLAAGVLTVTLGWRWFFFLNIPLGLAAVALTLLVVPESRDESASHHIDLIGFGTITAGVVLLVLGIQMSGQLGWSSPVVYGSLIVGTVLVALFLVLEPRIKNPFVDLRLFENAVFLGVIVILFGWNWMWMAMMFFLTLYLQHIQELSPVATGLMFLAFAIPFAAISSIAGKVANIVSRRGSILIGLALACIGALVFAVISPTTSLVIVGAGFVGFGAGGALTYNAAATSGMSSVPQAEAGTASGVQNTMLQLGAAFGLAVASALFKAVENDSLASLLRSAGATVTSRDQSEIRGLLSGSEEAEARLSSIAPAATHQIEGIVNSAFMDGFHAVMFLGLGVGIVAIIAAAVSQRGPKAAAC